MTYDELDRLLTKRPLSYEDMQATAKPIRQLLEERGVNIDAIKSNLHEYVEKLEIASRSKR